MRYRFDECVERGKIVRIPVDMALVEKELREAEADLAAAERSLADRPAKWAIIRGYYSLFHAPRSPVFLTGYQENGHLPPRFSFCNNRVEGYTPASHGGCCQHNPAPVRKKTGPGQRS